MLDSTDQVLFEKSSHVASLIHTRFRENNLKLERTEDERWDGERLYLEYVWEKNALPRVALLRLQINPGERVIWIGWLEIHPDYRGNGVGSNLVLSIDQGARLGKMRALRLFSRRRAIGFWEKMGFLPEHDPRYFRKNIVQGCFSQESDIRA